MTRTLLHPEDVPCPTCGAEVGVLCRAGRFCWQRKLLAAQRLANDESRVLPEGAPMPGGRA